MDSIDQEVFTQIKKTYEIAGKIKICSKANAAIENTTEKSSTASIKS